MAALSVIIQPGDTLWSATSRTLQQALGRGPTNQEVTTAILTANIPTPDPSQLPPGTLVTYNLRVGEAIPPPRPAAAEPTELSAPTFSPPEARSSSPVMGAAKKKLYDAGANSTAKNLTDFMSL